MAVVCVVVESFLVVMMIVARVDSYDRGWKKDGLMDISITLH